MSHLSWYLVTPYTAESPDAENRDEGLFREAWVTEGMPIGLWLTLWPSLCHVTSLGLCFPSSQGKTLNSIISQDFSGVTDVAWWVISARSDQGRVDMGWAPWGWLQTTSTAPQHHEGCFSAFQKETDCEGQCGKLCSKLELAKEEQERRKKTRLSLPFGQTVHQHLLQQKYNKKHTSASGSKMLQEHPVVFQGVTRPIQAACACAIQAEHLLSPLMEALLMLTSILFCYSDYSGHRLQTDSHWVSFVWSLQHFKKFSTCCQHLNFEQFYVKIQVGNFSCKVRSTTSALILTRWSLAGTE